MSNPLEVWEFLKGLLSEEKKKEMISGFRETVAEIEARPVPDEKLVPHTRCFIEEIDS